MCGRYGLTISQDEIATAYGVERLLVEHVPRFNIAPTQDVPVFLEDDRGARVEGFRWGLVPVWADDPTVGARMINARAETVARKPAYRGPWADGRRCLVLADGFYEWRKTAGAGAKVPHWIAMADGRPFGFAGLWERWEAPDSRPLHSVTILTTRPNALVRPIHDRMPVVLGEAAAWERWVDPAASPEDVEELLGPWPAEEMHAVPVSTYVNRPSNEGPDCIRPLA